jgi:translation initiation factor IF-3
MVYVDEAGASKSSVVSREEALKFSRGLKMDLVLSK